MTSHEGRVTGLQRSDGGVPKHAVTRATVGSDGMAGDRQANRKHHGGPLRALCLYSQELLDALAAEGHAVTRGTLGENVSVEGLAWGLVQPGTRLLLGEVEVEVTSFAAPCFKLREAFSDGEWLRVSERVRPGWSRVYVRVLKEGEIAVGDRVRIVD